MGEQTVINITDATKVRAVVVGINLTTLREAIPKLEAACNGKLAAAEDFQEAIQLAALQTGILPGVLSQYITARCKDTVAKKAKSAGQLSLLFEEIE